MQVRPAQFTEIPYLQSRLAECPTWEQVDLSRGIAFVAEEDGERIGFVNGRLIWQVEPLLIFPEYMKSRKRGVHHLRRKASWGLFHALDSYLADPEQNTTGIHSYFCHVVSRPVMRMEKHLGFTRLYPGGRLYGKDLLTRSA